MTEHLSNQILESCRRRAISATDLQAADEHLAVCSDCRQKLGEPQALSALAGFFRRDIELLATHLDYEQIEPYIRGRLTPEEGKSVESHLRECVSCQSEVEDLRAYAAQFDTQSITRLAPIGGQSLWQILSNLIWLNNLRNRFARFSPGAWRLAGAAAAVLLLLTITILLREPARNNNVTIETYPSPLPSPSQNQIVPQNVPSRSLPGETLPPQVDLAMRTEDLKLPAEIGDWVGTAREAKRGAEKAETFSLISPKATFINTDKPTLRWHPLAGATSYSVEVSDDNYNEVASASGLTSTQWTIDKNLARGAEYSWQVKAFADGKELGLSPEAKFKALEKSKADELARAKKSYGANHLAMGVIYAQAGLLDEAESEFKAELKANPRSRKASRLLQKLNELRQSN
jgi:hypothetical protein